MFLQPQMTLISTCYVPSSNDVSGNKPMTKNLVMRCKTCSIRTGLTGFTCRCGGNFCGQHRYAEEHSCSFDYKANDIINLKKNLDNTGLHTKLPERI